jgi:hypothetical protein
MQSAIALSLQVLSDWRMILAALVVLLSMTAFRYVGLVYHKSPKRRRIAASLPGAAPAPAAREKEASQAPEDSVE